MKQTFVSAQQLRDFDRSIPTPYHLYHEEGIRRNAERLYDAFAWNRGYKEYFAVKATPNPSIMKILHEEGCGMDCSTITELMLCERVGIMGEDIMFSSNATPAEDFLYAHKLGAIINLDDFTHIAFLEKVLGKLPEKLCCRFNPGGYFSIANAIMDHPGDAKYGMTKPQIMEAARVMKGKGVRKWGSMHSSLPTPPQMLTILLWRVSCLSWRLRCSKQQECP